MTVMNRRKEIALLLSLGVYKDEIKKHFLPRYYYRWWRYDFWYTLLDFYLFIFWVPFDLIDLPADVYGSSKLPLELSGTDFSMIVVGATDDCSSICFLSST